jgi:hypothetical protein
LLDTGEWGKKSERAIFIIPESNPAEAGSNGVVRGLVPGVFPGL